MKPVKEAIKLGALKELHRFVKKSLGRKLPKFLVEDIANAPLSSEIKFQDPVKENDRGE